MRAAGAGEYCRRNRRVRPGARRSGATRGPARGPSSGEEKAAPREAAQTRVRPFDPFAGVSP